MLLALESGLLNRSAHFGRNEDKRPTRIVRMDWLVVMRMNLQYQRFKPPLYGHEITKLARGCLQEPAPKDPFSVSTR